MDPYEVLEFLVNAITHGNEDEAEEHASDLRNWLERGGFLPELSEARTEEIVQALLTLILDR